MPQIVPAQVNAPERFPAGWSQRPVLILLAPLAFYLCCSSQASIHSALRRIERRPPTEGLLAPFERYLRRLLTCWTSMSVRNTPDQSSSEDQLSQEAIDREFNRVRPVEFVLTVLVALILMVLLTR